MNACLTSNEPIARFLDAVCAATAKNEDNDAVYHLPLFHRKVQDLPSERVTGQLDPDVREEKVGIVMKRMMVMVIMMMMMMMKRMMVMAMKEMIRMMVMRCYYMAYQLI